MNRSIKAKIILGLVIAITIPMVAFFVFTTINMKDRVVNEFYAVADQKLKKVESTVDQFLDEAKQNITMVVNYDGIQNIHDGMTTYLDDTETKPARPDPDDAEGQALTRFFSLVQSNHSGYTDLYVGTKYGGFLVSNPLELPGGYDPRVRPWYKQAVARPGEAVASKAYISTDGNPMISVARVALDASSGEPLGVAAIDIALTDLATKVKQTRLGETGYAIVIQDDGVILVDASNEKNNFKNVDELAPAYQKMFDIDSGHADVMLDDKEMMAQVWTSPKSGWKFIGLIERAEVMAPVGDMLVEEVSYLLIGFALVIIVIWVFMDRLIVRPLKQVVDFLGNIAGGLYDERVDHSRKDEIGSIFNALNALTATLAQNLEEINSKTREAEEKAEAAQEAMAEAEDARQQAERAKSEGLTQAAVRLEDVVERVSVASTDISERSEEIRQGTDVQAERIQATATAMEEMNATVLEVARNSSEAAQVSDDAKSKALKGRDQVSQSIEAMATTRRQTDTLKDDMANLDQRADSIGAIMTVIEDIADQTNLLALNAAIEAARAGDAGRGFAVVADEVRKLAEKTMGATKEVGDSIRSIQDAASRNIVSMDEAVADLERAVELTEKSGVVLDGIVESVEQSANQIQEIATAAEEQSATSEEINQSIDEINRITLETAQGVNESSQSLQELSEQVRELSGLIAELKQG